MAGYSTTADNELSSDGTFNYQHDADGNTTVRTRISSAYATDYQTTYTWDYRNRLTDVEYFDNDSVLIKHVHYVYGVFDHLIATEVDSTGSGQYATVQHYVLDVSPQTPSAGVPGTALAQPVLQFDGSQTLTVRYLVGLDPTGNPAVVAQETVPSTTQAGLVVWAADDNLGTPHDLLNDSGTLVDHRAFESFGQIVYESDPTTSFWAGYGGGYFDPFTGMINNYERWYDTVTARWLSRDPSDFGGGDANLFRYVQDSPLSSIDREGLDSADAQRAAQQQQWAQQQAHEYAAQQQNAAEARQAGEAAAAEYNAQKGHKILQSLAMRRQAAQQRRQQRLAAIQSKVQQIGAKMHAWTLEWKAAQRAAAKAQRKQDAERWKIILYEGVGYSSDGGWNANGGAGVDDGNGAQGNGPGPDGQ